VNLVTNANHINNVTNANHINNGLAIHCNIQANDLAFRKQLENLVERGVRAMACLELRNLREKKQTNKQ
jgi:hypothetical protein